jgi:hypothetical protein
MTMITITAQKARFPGNLADELGALQGQIKELRDAERALKDALIETGRAKVEGNFFSVSISEIEDTFPIDWEVAFAALVPKTRQDRAAEFTKLRRGGFRVQARAKSTAVAAKAA